MKSFLLITFLLSSPFAKAMDLSGRWQSDSGEILQIYPLDEGFLAYNKISYVDKMGSPTGAEIHYYWNFSKEDSSNHYRGKLNTVDTHWDCELDNGHFEVKVLSQDQLHLIYPQITFQKISRYISREEVQRVPVYCDYRSRRESFEYICGWKTQKVRVPKSYLGSECKITSRNFIPIELKRVN